MRRLSTVAAAAALLALTACGGDADTEVAEPAADQTAEAMPEPTMPTTPAADALLDANSASADQLIAAGIDSTTAAVIVDGRPYNGVLALDEVLGGTLDDAERENVYRTVWIPIDLNSAAPEEILLIPGIGERMLHEFEEYRPYRGMEEFRREIGKYVDDEEVARLERYVTLAP